MLAGEAQALCKRYAFQVGGPGAARLSVAVPRSGLKAGWACTLALLLSCTSLLTYELPSYAAP